MDHRIRRIKCDEGKPSCLKCTSTGRKCDGYSVKPILSKDAPAKPPTDDQLVQARSLIIPNELYLGVDGTYQERRGFQFFLTHTWPQLSVAIGESSPGTSYFCNSLIFQASHVDSAIRHAIVATGSLDERFQINKVLTSDNEDANRQHDFACSQYCKAIGNLRRTLSNETEQSTEIILMTCFIFIIFEFLQGNDAGALTHLKSGLEILSRLNLEEIEPDRTRPDSTYSLLPRSRIGDFRLYAMELFTILDRTACVWLAERFVGTISDIPESLEYGSLVKEGFHNVDEADKYLTRIFWQLRRTLPARGVFRGKPVAPSGTCLTALPLQEVFLTSLHSWSCAMEVFLTRSFKTVSVEDSYRSTLLQIGHTVATLMLTASCIANEDDFYAASDSSFEYIVSTTASLLRPVNVMFNRKVFRDASQIFSFTEGTIQPLYFTALKCTNLMIRQNALALLTTSPWREGAWDSAAMARIARRKIKLRDEKRACES